MFPLYLSRLFPEAPNVGRYPAVSDWLCDLGNVCHIEAV